MAFLSHPIEDGHELEEHCVSVAKKARELCQGLNLNCQQTAYYAGLLHDIGKLNPWYQIFFQTIKKYRTWLEQNLSLGTISRYLHLPASSTHSLLSAWAADKLLDGTAHGLSDKQKMQVLCAIEGHHTNLDHAMALSPVINRDCAMHTPTCRHFRNSQLDMVVNLQSFHQSQSKYCQLFLLALSFLQP